MATTEKNNSLWIWIGIAIAIVVVFAVFELIKVRAIGDFACPTQYGWLLFPNVCIHPTGWMILGGVLLGAGLWYLGGLRKSD